MAYFRYFNTHTDIATDNSISATERLGQAHLEVAYNEDRLPVFITRYSQLGIAQGYILNSYDNQQRLQVQGFLDSLKQLTRAVWYGADEPWSTAFREYQSQPRRQLNYQGQASSFHFTPGGRIASVVFATVSGHRYGQIKFQYDDHQHLLDESWYSLPQTRLVRRYHYKWLDGSDGIRLREFGKKGELISDVTLEQAPADELYRVPPPRSGNILDEAALILEQIAARKEHLPYPAVIPRTEWDRLILNSGEELDIHFLELSGTVVRFRQPPSNDELSLPLTQVQVIISRYGQRIYP